MPEMEVIHTNAWQMNGYTRSKLLSCGPWLPPRSHHRRRRSTGRHGVSAESLTKLSVSGAAGKIPPGMSTFG